MALVDRGPALAELGEEDFSCPICLNLLYQPCVNAVCGHAFCFWCMHRSMSPFVASQCPVCRSTYSHLPAVCQKLSFFLERRWPASWAERRQEVEDEIRELGLEPESASGAASAAEAVSPLLASSQERKGGPEEGASSFHNEREGSRGGASASSDGGAASSDSPTWACGDEQGECGPCGSHFPRAASRSCSPRASADPHHAREAYLCDWGGCRHLVAEPVVLNCGHSLCACHAPAPGAPGPGVQCPRCGRCTPGKVARCPVLGTLVGALFPGAQDDRLGCRALPAPPAAEDGDSAAAPPVPVRASADDPRSAVELARRASSSVQLVSELLSSEIPGAIVSDLALPMRTGWREGRGPGRDLGGPEQPDLAPSQPDPASLPRPRTLPRDLMRKLGEESYVHHGVGCDVCGMYPLVGRRLKCVDCVGGFGFDACESCHRAGWAQGAGRFMQGHGPGHRMEWVRPRLTAMHLLQALHPELPMQQLLQLLHMTVGAEEDDEPEGLPQPSTSLDGTPLGQSGLDDSEEREVSDSDVRDAPLGGLRRGPRPARVDGAVWPSPSAPEAPEGSER